MSRKNRRPRALRFLPQLVASAALCLVLVAGLRLAALPDRYASLAEATDQDAASEVLRLSVQRESIKPFAYYDVNAVNPFLPYHLRGKDLPSVPQSSTADDKPVPLLVEQGNNEAKTSDLKNKVIDVKVGLPIVKSESMPQVVGVVTLADDSRVLVHYAQEQRHLQVGDTIGMWTMTAYKQGVVSFKDVDGGAVDIPMSYTRSAPLSGGGK